MRNTLPRELILRENTKGYFIQSALLAQINSILEFSVNIKSKQ
jgi:hypothetical protein